MFQNPQKKSTITFKTARKAAPKSASKAVLIPSKTANLLRSTKPGTSLLVALGLTTIIVLVSLGVTTIVVSSIRESANVTGANQAYYAAEGALEEGLLENQKQGAGYTSSTTAVSQTAPQSNYVISGQVGSSSAYGGISNYKGDYGIPAPGTGNAGSDCDSLNPDTTLNFNYDATTKKFTYGSSGQNLPEEHPCNWNKLKVGESVSIPLYYTCGTSSATDPNCNSPSVHTVNILNQNSNLSLRIRTACPNNDTFCTAINRPKLDTFNGDPAYNADDPIVSWEITGTDPTGATQYDLQPVINYKKGNYSPGQSGWKNSGSSIIYENLINSAKGSGFEILNSQFNKGQDSNNCKGLIISFLTKGNSTTSGCSTPWSTIIITKPVLKLTLIHSLQENPTTQIPYLEYQIITSIPTGNPTNTSQTVTAQGYSGTFKQVLEVKQPQASGLLEYVIQQ